MQRKLLRILHLMRTRRRIFYSAAGTLCAAAMVLGHPPLRAAAQSYAIGCSAAGCQVDNNAGKAELSAASKTSADIAHGVATDTSAAAAASASLIVGTAVSAETSTSAEHNVSSSEIAAEVNKASEPALAVTQKSHQVSAAEVFGPPDPGDELSAIAACSPSSEVTEALLTSASVADGSVVGAQIADSADVTTPDTDNSITIARILDGTIASSSKKIADVTTIVLARTEEPVVKLEAVAAATSPSSTIDAGNTAHGAADGVAATAAASPTTHAAAPVGVVTALELADANESVARINGQTVARIDKSNEDILPAGVQAVLRGSTTEDDSEAALQSAHGEPLDAAIETRLPTLEIRLAPRKNSSCTGR